MKTPLYERHAALGAKLVPFAGWEMPIQYQGILTEHRAVREHVGLFDVSHMGRIIIKGADAEKLLDHASTNRISGKADGTATYTVWCNAHGGCIDDLIVYKINNTSFFVIANAANRDKDLSHIKSLAKQLNANVEITNAYSRSGIIALQGPSAFPMLTSLLPEAASIKPMHFIELKNENLFISRTGYTGAGGFEFYGSADEIIEWWDLLLDKGQIIWIQPIGLGARDTLRLEMGFALYGHELADDIAPNESCVGLDD